MVTVQRAGRGPPLIHYILIAQTLNAFIVAELMTEELQCHTPIPNFNTESTEQTNMIYQHEKI
jgi:hypothetical protein